MEPEVFGSWMNILKSVPESVLWIYASSRQDIADFLSDEAEKVGVDKSRLIFAKDLPTPEHLARCRVADLFLDTFEYNAGATAAGVLRADLPILTRYGTTLLSRMGASFLKALDLKELIAYSKEEYEQKAIDLALNPQKLKSLRSKLANEQDTAPFWDTAKWVKNLETAYTKIWDDYLDGIYEDVIVK